MDKEISGLIEELKKYDNENGYELKYSEVKKKLEPVINKLSKKGDESLDLLHQLLRNVRTWSSVFALEILKNIKNEKSIFPLINYILKIEKKDYGDYGEDAMLALTEIGMPAILPLIEENKRQFEKKTFYFFLVGALTEIKNDEVYEFMKEITEDYLKNEDKYDEWFYIDAFTSDFPKQGKKEILPLLKELISLDRISKSEKIEIKSTLEMLEDPVGYEQSLKEDVEKLKPLAEEFLKEESITKKINQRELKKRMFTHEDDLEIQFKCLECKKKQNINPGLIKILGDKKSEFHFENEIMCRYCFSNNIKPTIQGGRDIMFQAMGTIMGNRTGVVSADSKVMVENNPIQFKKSYDYILNRIKEEPENAVLNLRAGNIARNFNKYSEAIKHYEKAIELNSKLIAAYLNLIEIYDYRNKYYKIKDAKVSAIFYLNEMMDLFRTQDFDTITLQNSNDVIQFIGEKSESLGVNFPELVKFPISHEKKIGRNEPCPCGSGKKYKKCCLDESEEEIGK